MQCTFSFIRYQEIYRWLDHKDLVRSSATREREGLCWKTEHDTCTGMVLCKPLKIQLKEFLSAIFFFIEIPI